MMGVRTSSLTRLMQLPFLLFHRMIWFAIFFSEFSHMLPEYIFSNKSITHLAWFEHLSYWILRFELELRMMVAGKGFSLNRIKPKFAACPVRGMSRELLFLQSSPPTWTAQFAKAKQHTSQEAQADAGRQRRRRRKLPEPERAEDGRRSLGRRGPSRRAPEVRPAKNLLEKALCFEVH